MAKNSLNDWSTTAASNTDIAGININVGCPPADVGGFMRTCMAQIAYAVQGTGGTIPATWNVGTLVASTGTFSGNVSVGGALAITGATTLSGGVAITGAATIGGTLNATGAVTFAASLNVGTFTYTSGTTYFGSTTFLATQSGPSQLLQFAANNYLVFVPGTGFELKSGGRIDLTCGATYVNGVQVVTNSGTWGISISGYAATAGTATNASGSSGNFTVAGYLVVNGGTPLSGNGWYATQPGTGQGAWTYSISGLFSNGVLAGGFFTTSDERVKTEIDAITPEQGAAWVMRGSPVRFRLSGKPSAGFIAQWEVRAGRGEAVESMPDDDPRVAVSDGVAPDGHRLIVEYQQHIAYLTAALQAAFARIESLEARG